MRDSILPNPTKAGLLFVELKAHVGDVDRHAPSLFLDRGC